MACTFRPLRHRAREWFVAHMCARALARSPAQGKYFSTRCESFDRPLYRGGPAPSTNILPTRTSPLDVSLEDVAARSWRSIMSGSIGRKLESTRKPHNATLDSRIQSNLRDGATRMPGYFADGTKIEGGISISSISRDADETLMVMAAAAVEASKVRGQG